DRLKNALLLNRFGQVVQGIFIKLVPGLVRVWTNIFNTDFLHHFVSRRGFNSRFVCSLLTCFSCIFYINLLLVYLILGKKCFAAKKGINPAAKSLIMLICLFRHYFLALPLPIPDTLQRHENEYHNQ